MMLVGSCFAQNMAAKMQESLWPAVSPLGVLYNPLSIERVIRLLLPGGNSAHLFEQSLFTTEDGIMRSWFFDSSMADVDKEALLKRFISKTEIVNEHLTDLGMLTVTLGTSWVYALSESPDYIVANCHKQPAGMFLRRRLTVEEIVDVWRRLCGELKVRYPKLEIIFTVSPVRHLKDGFSGNARSKAILLLATETLCEELPYCHYFPAYEIVNDDLRDYRFYASDLVHPSQEAVDYLWEIFKAMYLDPEGISLLEEGERLRKAWYHRPIYQGTQSDRLLQEEVQRRLRIQEKHALLRKKWPSILPLL